MTDKKRVITYVDGFNLYFGMRERGWGRYLWLNLELLATNLLKPYQTLAGVKYFTSRVSGDPKAPGKAQRQSTFIDALAIQTDVKIFYGHYRDKSHVCSRCGHEDLVPDEKMTDVNIAVEMMTDAFRDRFDVALLMSGDSDLVGPVKSIRRLFPNKWVVIAFPPRRVSMDLRTEANASFIIGRKKLADSQFPDEITGPQGHLLRRPSEWL
jgi:uncharacterized LabA/DUF88 family protein